MKAACNSLPDLLGLYLKQAKQETRDNTDAASQLSHSRRAGELMSSCKKMYENIYHELIFGTSHL